MFPVRLGRWVIPLWIAAGCGDEGVSAAIDETGATVADTEGTTGAGADAPSPTSGDASASAATQGSSATGGSGVGTDGSGADETGSSGDSGGEADSATTGIEPPDDALFYEPFDGRNGASWAPHWTDVGGLLAQEIVGGRGRLQAQTGAVGRMVLTGYDETDVDISATVIFDDWSNQGFGLYVRQNGGYLTSTDPPGSGYAAYVEGGFLQQIGVWRETGGVEQIISGTEVAAPLAPGVAYRMRLRCVQEGAETRLQAKLWPAQEAEPAAWDVDIVDASPQLQSVGGTFAVDMYNYEGTGSVLVDDVVVVSAR